MKPSYFSLQNIELKWGELMLLIKNANLLNMAGIEYEQMDILIKADKIEQIGKINLEDYQELEIIDAKGKLVTPGLIDAHCHVGMMEDGMRDEGDDVNEMTNPIMPEVRGIDGIKPQDPAFRAALEAGITTVITGPGSGDVIGGTFCALKTHGKTVLDMVIVEEIAMKMALGENPKRVYGNQNKAPMTRMGSAALMREALFKAKSYHEKKKKYKEDVQNQILDAKEPDFDMKMESLSRVFDGLKVKIHAHQQDDIVTAIRIIDEFELDASIDHCTEGYFIPEVLKSKKQKIIIGPTLSSRSKIELKNLSFDGGNVYYKHDIPFALMTDHPVIPLEHALVQGAIYVSRGVPAIEILKALSINAARIVGLDYRIGSIEVGKDADIVIWSGDPFHYLTRPEKVIINGKVVIE